MSMAPVSSRRSAPRAETATGTSFSTSSRRRAVTTTSSILVASWAVRGRARVLGHRRGRGHAPGHAGQQGASSSVGSSGCPSPVVSKPDDAFIQRSMIFTEPTPFRARCQTATLGVPSRRPRPVAPLHRPVACGLAWRHDQADVPIARRRRPRPARSAAQGPGRRRRPIPAT